MDIFGEIRIRTPTGTFPQETRGYVPSDARNLSSLVFMLQTECGSGVLKWVFFTNQDRRTRSIPRWGYIQSYHRSLPGVHCNVRRGDNIFLGTHCNVV